MKKIPNKPRKPIVLVDKRNGKIVEYFQSFLGPAITFVDLESTDYELVSDLCDDGLFIFNDDPKFNLENYEYVGEI